MIRFQRRIGCAFKVHQTLGFGFLESVYERALSIELSGVGIEHERQTPVKVHYGGHVVGNFVCDLLLEGNLIIELKSVTKLARDSRGAAGKLPNGYRNRCGLTHQLRPRTRQSPAKVP